MRLNRNNIRLPEISQSVEPKRGLGLRLKKAGKGQKPSQQPGKVNKNGSPVEFADSVIF